MTIALITSRAGCPHIRSLRNDDLLNRQAEDHRTIFALACSRRITQVEYDTKARELKDQEADIAVCIEQHRGGEGSFRTTLVSLISLALTNILLAATLGHLMSRFIDTPTAFVLYQ